MKLFPLCLATISMLGLKIKKFPPKFQILIFFLFLIFFETSFIQFLFCIFLLKKLQLFLIGVWNFEAHTLKFHPLKIKASCICKEFILFSICHVMLNHQQMILALFDNKNDMWPHFPPLINDSLFQIACATLAVQLISW